MARKIMTEAEQDAFLNALPEEMNPHFKMQKLHRHMTKPRDFFRSVRAVTNSEGKVTHYTKHTYVRERLPGEIRGKLNIKAAKKAKVRAMKAAQVNTI